MEIPSTTLLRKYLASMLTFERAHLARECALVKNMTRRVLLLYVIWIIIEPSTGHSLCGYQFGSVCGVHDEDCIF